MKICKDLTWDEKACQRSVELPLKPRHPSCDCLSFSAKPIKGALKQTSSLGVTHKPLFAVRLPTLSVNWQTSLQIKGSHGPTRVVKFWSVTVWFSKVKSKFLRIRNFLMSHSQFCFLHTHTRMHTHNLRRFHPAQQTKCSLCHSLHVVFSFL